MQEKIYTIPLNDAFLSGDECPFCNLERESEQHVIRFVAGPGASYMDTGVRAVTDMVGFCPDHMKKLYHYGNTLGNALILQTHFSRLLKEFEMESQKFEIPPKKHLFLNKNSETSDSYWKQMRLQVNRCYICDKINYNMERYYQTFFYLIKDEEFRQRVESCHGFCFKHFSMLLEKAEKDLPNSQRTWFYPTVFRLMKENLQRVKEDLDWLIAKHDYRNADKSWKNSKDALPRAMQKLEGGHPEDPPLAGDP